MNFINTSLHYKCNLENVTYVNNIFITFVNIRFTFMKDQTIKLLKEENLTSARFAEKIGVQPSSISHILSGRNKPSFDFLIKILKFFPDINSEWLLTGKGNIYKSNKSPTFFDDNDFSPDDNKPKTKQKPVSLPPGNITEKGTYPNEILKSNEIKEIIDKGKEIVDRIVIFYSDNTFKEYKPR